MAFKANSAESVGGAAVNLIGRGTEVVGDIRAESSIRIDGSVKGKIICKNTVTIGEGGTVEGDIEAVNAIISGKVTGKVVVKQKLNLESRSVLSGELKAGKLVVDEGAVFNGTSKMGSDGAMTPNIVPETSKEKSVQEK